MLGEGKERQNWVDLAKNARKWDEFCITCPVMYDFVSKKYKVEMAKYVIEMRMKTVSKKYEIRNWSDQVEFNIGRVPLKKDSFLAG